MTARVLTMLVYVAAALSCWFAWRAEKAERKWPWWIAAALPLIAVAASLALLALSFLLARCSGRGTRVLAFLGAEAMSIYVLGEPVKVCCRLCFKTLHLPVGVSFALMVVLMLALPVLLSRLIAKSDVVSLLLLGMKKKG